jgi:hypothetical protein
MFDFKDHTDIAQLCLEQSWPGLEVRTTQLGRGVFTTKLFPKGDVVCNYAGKLYNSIQLDTILDGKNEDDQVLIGE